jgi:hypothetical protein
VADKVLTMALSSVQNAIWWYSAGNGLAVCNGNRIDDNTRCDNGHCQLFRRCDRVGPMRVSATSSTC